MLNLTRQCRFKFVLASVAITVAVSTTYADPPAWRSPDRIRILENDAVSARLHAGILVQLLHKRRGAKLIDAAVEQIPDQLPVFGAQARLDLETCEVVERCDPGQVRTSYRAADGTRWSIHWKIEPGKGDLVLQTAAHTNVPVEEFRYLFPGCDVVQHTLVWIDAYGVARTANAPWNDRFLGDPLVDGSPMRFPHPVVALFQGRASGWFLEARDARAEPTCLMVRGMGDRATFAVNRRFIVPTKSPVMHEIRIRTYEDRWESAVDPFVEWMERDAGFVALDKLPEKQAWVNDLKTQSYIGVGNYEGVDRLAERVDPAKTLIGRQGEFRYHAFDIGYPDYRVPEAGARWAGYVRKRGFHVGMHFNVGSVSEMFPDLIERFKPGMHLTGTDENGNETYEHIYTSPHRMFRVSAALKDWRDYLIEQVRHAVEAGIDVIYLDETMVPHGRILVGDTNGFQGTLLLMQEILQRYPHVAIETEQFNMLTARYGKIALSQMPLGHPLSGYIFRKFVKVVPEGLMYSPTDTSLMDAFDSWGFMLPGGDTQNQQSWMQIIEAYHRYDLTPDAGLPRIALTNHAGHWTGGASPVATKSPAADGQKLFGLQGTGGVTAHFEKHPTKRGLVVYEPGAEPKWFGTRHSGIRSYAGPGLPSYHIFRHDIKDWLVYDGDTLLGLNPLQSYAFDNALRTSPKRFHVCKVPDDFEGVIDQETRTPPQEVGPDDLFFRMVFTGHGEIGVYVPTQYEAYLNGRKLEPDPTTRRANATINASYSRTTGLGYHIELGPADKVAGSDQKNSVDRPAWLIAFRKTDCDLVGDWLKFPWHASKDVAKWVTGNKSNGFSMGVGAIGRFVGRIPSAHEIRIQGSYKMNDDAKGPPGDGVIRINGKELFHAPHGTKPYPETPFDVDLSAYAGQYVFVEFESAGSVRGASADWNNPRIVVKP